MDRPKADELILKITNTDPEVLELPDYVIEDNLLI